MVERAPIILKHTTAAIVKTHNVLRISAILIETLLIINGLKFQISPAVKKLRRRLEPTQVLDSKGGYEIILPLNEKWGRWLKDVRNAFMGKYDPLQPAF